MKDFIKCKGGSSFGEQHPIIYYRIKENFCPLCKSRKNIFIYKIHAYEYEKVLVDLTDTFPSIKIVAYQGNEYVVLIEQKDVSAFIRYCCDFRIAEALLCIY
jgi:hypothetical protein